MRLFVKGLDRGIVADKVSIQIPRIRAMINRCLALAVVAESGFFKRSIKVDIQGSANLL
jgi:hypothetical protein